MAVGVMGNPTRDGVRKVPIRAVSEQGDIHAFTLNSEQWTALKANYRGINLQMPCCGIAAVPKTSTRGNYFFAHARREGCAAANESPEHLYCKALIAKAALDAGWTVTTERPGTSPNGEDWVADVFCEKGTAKLAFEVQLSPQTKEETIRRQLRYKRSGVRGAWFFGARAQRGTTAFCQETPAFNLRSIVVGEMPTIEQFDVNLPDFVNAMLQKRLRWTVPSYSRPHLVEFIADFCWACQRPIKQVIEHLHGGDENALTPEDFYEGRWDLPAYTVATLSKSLEAVQLDVTNDQLAAQGLNLIGRRDVINGKQTRFPYCNLCLYCHAPQNNHFLSKRLHAALQVQSSHEEDAFLGARENRGEKEEEPQAIQVALISREVKGQGTWVLHALPTQFD